MDRLAPFHAMFSLNDPDNAAEAEDVTAGLVAVSLALSYTLVGDIAIEAADSERHPLVIPPSEALQLADPEIHLTDVNVGFLHPNLQGPSGFVVSKRFRWGSATNLGIWRVETTGREAWQ